MSFYSRLADWVSNVRSSSQKSCPVDKPTERNVFQHSAFCTSNCKFFVAAKLSKSSSTKCLSPRPSPNHADQFFLLLQVTRERAGVEHMISNSVGIV